MIQRATLIWALLAMIAGAGLFVMKYQVQALEDRLARINAEIVADQEAVHVLKAEWSYLNRPARLDDLGRRLLKLEPITAARIIRITDIPMLAEADEGAPGAAPSPAQTTPLAADPPTPLFAKARRAP
jgi:hypothetical protein